MALIVLVRYFEIKKDRNIISEKLRNYCDKKIVLFAKFLSVIQKRFWNLLIAIRNYITHLISHAIVHSWEFLVKKSAKYINMVRGKGMLRNKGSVSFFSKLKEDLDK